MRTLIEKYSDPIHPGLVNYLNLHHDILAVHKFVQQEKDPVLPKQDRNVDMVSLFVRDNFLPFFFKMCMEKICN